MSATSNQVGAAPTLGASPLLLAAMASAGAGLVHAAAAGSHNGDRTLAVLFSVAAAFPLGWATLAVARPGRLVSVAGVALNALMVLAWFLTRTDVGVPGLGVLGSGESVGVQDGVAASLAALAAGLAVWATRRPTAPSWMSEPVLAPAAALLMAAIAVPAMAAGHQHQHDDEVAGPDQLIESPDTSTVAFVDDDAVDDSEAPGDDQGPDGSGDGHDHDPGGPITSIYDPRVTPTQRAAARALIDETREGMQRFVTIDDVVAEGYVSIGDGRTGFEHFVHIGYIADGLELDPQRIESIVARVNPDGTKDIVSAMYLMSPGSTMDDVPDIAGALTTWHDHQDLCWEGIRVVGRVGADGSCPRGEFRGTAPMLHVWLEPHPCGPFAGLEGHGGGCGHDDH
jgi:hypothetical protein